MKEKTAKVSLWLIVGLYVVCAIAALVLPVVAIVALIKYIA